jgi:Sec-independent protein secretion pathway component TatC
MMAGPLMLLYEISILGARIFQKKPSSPEDNGESDEIGKDDD